MLAWYCFLHHLLYVGHILQGYHRCQHPAQPTKYSLWCEVMSSGDIVAQKRKKERKNKKGREDIVNFPPPEFCEVIFHLLTPTSASFFRILPCGVKKRITLFSESSTAGEGAQVTERDGECLDKYPCSYSFPRHCVVMDSDIKTRISSSLSHSLEARHSRCMSHSLTFITWRKLRFPHCQMEERDYLTWISTVLPRAVSRPQTHLKPPEGRL